MVARPHRAGSVALVLSACMAACSLLTDLGGLSGGGPADASDATSATDASDGASDATDASRDRDAPNVDAEGGGCSGDAGPTPVRVGAFCIDSTEVTRQQWSAFVAASVSLTTLAPECAFKTSWGSGNAAEPPFDEPATLVDWCDAWGYCRWAGKRLCGKVGGGRVDPAAFTSAADEWYVACSRGNSRAYPYGDTFVAGSCATDESNDGGFIPVGSRAECAGGYDGVFDMSGNAREWENACADGGCMLRGGAANEPAVAVACRSSFGPEPVAFSSPHTGFRCCSD